MIRGVPRIGVDTVSGNAPVRRGREARRQAGAQLEPPAWRIERPTYPNQEMIGTSVLLIAAGAILKFAATPHAEGVDLHAAGVILMIVGGVGRAIGLFLLVRGHSAGGPPRPELR